MASLTRASPVGPGRPATTSGTVSGDPTGFPDGSTTHAARCPSFRSTPRTGPDVASCTSVGTCSGLAAAHDACRYQRPRPGSNEIRYVTQRLAATRSAHTCCLWWNTTGTARLRWAPSFPTSAPGTLTLRCPAWSTRMVSFPNRFPDSPSALRNIRRWVHSDSHAWTLRCACARLFRVRQSRLPPGTTLGRPDASVVSTTPRRDVSWARRRVLPVPLARAAVPGDLAGMAAGRGRHPLRKFAGRRDEHGPLGGQCPHREVVLVLGRPGDRAGPPRRRLRSQSLLANLAGARPALSVQLPLAQPPHQVGAVQRPQERAYLPQCLLLGRGRVQPGPDRHPRRR